MNPGYAMAALRLDDTEELAREVLKIGRRCATTGLDPDAYAGITYAGIALIGHNMWVPRGVKIADDTELFGLVDEQATLVASLLAKAQDLQARAAAHRAWAIKILRSADYPRHPKAAAVRDDCDDALATLDDLIPAVDAALKKLRKVPDDVKTVYAAAYELIGKGGVLPFDGRWITGEIRATGPGVKP